MTEYVDLVCPFCRTSLTGVYWAWSDIRRGHCLKHGDIEAHRGARREERRWLTS